ncbi:hypothetical protein A3C60_02520 [Candidatus Nomurabacteria bacterium RIFCSPHIGHO2_02_FULL_37_45]|uniref:DUF3892 domain-containing protein n=2 Tax=Candidatus Nomuraibacteriota TaxID=1752729 RepID=A0A1F6Y7I1_9BACT|nr:MAG: hypothetical protein A3C60_02520 [Candidatus Nomurabacteria bacterium RIFCSPHIGHO2_02_FULL_37_45]OGI79437.1 MAG: hypothetical protein A3F19_01310 [Candidatus Nomurabacteria bacterium RIFCSPHIGHO2_12_FULL_37_29]OGI85278.1 MAG: hypothetical protein A3A92_02790 [Candidatus Nomurabacteria bacterium RIFCSPLOWO2_01_FULL_37_49]OGJ02292.1 MAG: hypothetical protein A3G98_01950 [Candidatus Nomurabacteria bacterium RIFCSPLOWO2_12_FULL_37_8]
MPIIEIHGKKVHIDGDSHSAKHAANYLKEYKENAEDIFQAARHDRINGVTHFETHRPAGYHGSTEFTVIHNRDNGEYELRKKTHHIF